MIEVNNNLLSQLEDINTGILDPNSQQFATVCFDGGEDADSRLITIIESYSGRVTQFDSKQEGLQYNPSRRRISSCVYVANEQCMVDGNGEALPVHKFGGVVKICTIQHKGLTLLEVHEVSKSEMRYLFKRLA